jgi:microcystin-dependent protein
MLKRLNKHTLGKTYSAGVRPQNATDLVIPQLLAATYNAVVGSPTQVAAGIATYSSIQTAVNALASQMGTLLILPGTYTENVKISNTIQIEAKGFGTVLVGSLTINGSYADVRALQVQGNVTFGASSSCNTVVVWQSPGNVFLDSGTNNDPTVIVTSLGTVYKVGQYPGDLKISAAGLIVPGYLNTDGSAISRTAYPSLFARIGTVFGAGDGSTTYNIPDYRGRDILGAGQGVGLTLRTLGTHLGEENHLLSISEMPSHNHNVYWNYNGGSGAYSGYIQGNSPSPPANLGPSATDYNGGSATHNNMQPGLVSNIWIKY